MAPVVPLMRARAEAVEVPPIKRSSVILAGVRAPEFLCQRPTMPDWAQVLPLTQIVPLKLGRVHVCAAVAADARVLR